MIKDFVNQLLIQLAVRLQKIAQTQTDKDGNYYVTLEQLHSAIKDIQENILGV